MTGRGQSLRSGSLRQTGLLMNAVYPMESPRRGRGRPRKYPLTSHLQLPNEEVEAGEEQYVQEGVYYQEEEHGEVAQEEELIAEGAEEIIVEMEDAVEMEMEIETSEDIPSGSQQQKIRQIQQQKMMIVTPMGGKRVAARGRPPAKRIKEDVTSGEVQEFGVSHEIEIEEDPIEGTGSMVVEEVVTGKRQRNPPKRFAEEGIEIELKTQLKPVDEKSTPQEDLIEPLLPNEAHIEEEVEISTTVRPVENPQPDSKQYDQPPPQPYMKVRGRPINSSIPPHRRPLPKDLVPPGIPPPGSQKRSLSNMHKDVKRLKPEKPILEVTETLPPPLTQPDQQEIHEPEEGPTTSDAPPPLEENMPSTSSAPPPPIPIQKVSIPTLEKKKREGGQDLPFEHMPKQRARHVSKAGILPSSSYDQGKYEMPTEVILEHGHHVLEQQPSDSLIHLEEGEYIEEEQTDLLSNEDKTNMMMKGSGQPRYIEVEENGVKVVYEVQGEEGEETEETIVEEEGMVTTEFVIEESPEEMVKENVGMVEGDVEEVEEQQLEEGEVIQNEEEEEDDLPPQLVPEEVQDDEVVAEVQKRHEQMEAEMEKEIVQQEENDDDDLYNMNMEPGQTFRLNSPGGRSHEVTLARDQDGNNVFIDENGVVVELVTDQGNLVEPSGVIEGELQQHMHEQGQRQVAETVERVAVGATGEQNEQQPDMDDLRNVEFNFLDTRNICCGLCGEIVLYETLVTEHLPSAHPEFLQPGVELEEVPYENWLKSRLRQESQTMKNGFRNYDESSSSGGFGGAVRLFSRGMRHLRKVSQIRVNPMEMTMEQLDIALNRKMIEKMGRKVPVTLIDRLHARCDVCSAVISLNKKFEVIHLVRHFNAWHPSEHRCSNGWKMQQPDMVQPALKMLSLHDFAVVDTESEQNNLQCIWCGMFMDRGAVGMHFSEVHGDQVEVPKCSLCLQEMVMCARLMEKYGEDFGISLPDEFHVHSTRLDTKYNSEKSLDKAIERYLKRVRTGQDVQDDEEEAEVGKDTICTTNSQQSFGRRNRMKRKFVKPCFRQICPTNSQYFEAFSACEWKCKLCQREVYGAVISAGAIKHYKEFHPAELENMQYELVKARLERIGDGSMEFVHQQLVECLICNLTYALHKPFNICRAIRHLRLKHPEVMPETSGKPISGAEVPESTERGNSVEAQERRRPQKSNITLGEVLTDPLKLERFRREHEGTQFDKVQVMYGVKPNNEPSYILLSENEVMDQKTAEAVAETMVENEKSENRERKPIDMYMEDAEIPTETVFNDTQIESKYEEQTVYEDEYSQQIGVGEEIVEMVEEVDNQKNVLQYMQGYDEQGESGIIDMDGNVMVEADEHGNYHEIINDGETVQEYGGVVGEEDVVDSDGNRVQFMTEEELRAAEARGDIQIEYVDAQGALIQFEEEEDARYHDQQ